MNQPNTARVAAACHDIRAIARCSRVLNYDLARWVTELRPQLQSKAHTLLLEIDDAALPPVLCDRAQLKQVIVNLVTNAHTFTDTGGQITVSAHAAEHCIRIDVTDTGTRAAHTGRSRGFEPFARQIVEAHGGLISVQAHGGHGSTFGFSLPIHREGRHQMGRSAA